MERYILKYLYDSTQDEWRKRYIDYMKLTLDHQLWSIGRQFSNSLEWKKNLNSFIILHRGAVTCEIGSKIKRLICKKIHNAFHIRQKRYEMHEQLTHIEEKSYDYRALSVMGTSFMTDECKKSLLDVKIRVDSIFDWSYSDCTWFRCVHQLLEWHKSMELLPFNEIIKETHVEELRRLYGALLEVLKNEDFDTVFVHTAELFETKIIIDIFRELGKTSIEIIHGIPGGNPLIEDRVDHLMVYGEQLRSNCIKYGFNPLKVHTLGNSKYCSNSISVPQSLRCSDEDVLVLTTATAVEHQHEWEYEKFSSNDGSLLVTYLYSVESVLKKNNIFHARLRPHPIISKEWLAQYVDLDFYQIDKLELSESLSRATLCVGQSSTVVLEAILYGVSYLVYEPLNEKLSTTWSHLNAPFDGSDPFLRVAHTEDELDEMIASEYCPDISLLGEYMEMFKPQVLLRVLRQETTKMR